MNESNPYSYQGQMAVPAAHAEVEERARFLKKTYTTLFLGILGLCGSLFAFGQFEFMQTMSRWMLSNWLLYIALFLGVTFAVHMVAERYPINVVAYALYVVFFGLILGPLVTIAEGQTLNQAVLITALIFSALTAYVFVSGKDFSFLGGILTIGLVGLLAIALAGWLFGFSVGIWWSIGAALLFAGYILYDTSRILHHYPTTAHIAAAIVLFTDVVLLFKQILILLMSRD